jgi:hypothetical protein
MLSIMKKNTNSVHGKGDLVTRGCPSRNQSAKGGKKKEKTETMEKRDS